MKHFATLLIFTIVFSFNLYSQVSDFADTDFRKADSVAVRYADFPLNDLKGLAEKLTQPFSKEEEKFRAIYFWVCNAIEGDYAYYLKNEKQRTKLQHEPKALKAWNDAFSKQVFTRLLNQKKTICTGYAYLIKALSAWAGLSCKIVDGYGRSVSSNVGGAGTLNHSWNAILLNGKWYLCDATWSSGVIDPKTGVFIEKFEDAYFLTTPTLFVRSHYPLDTAMLFLKNKPLLQEFLQGPIVYRAAYKYNANPIFPKSFIVSATTGETISICFNQQEMNSEEFELQVNNSVMKPQLNVEKNGHYSVDYTFKNRGTYIVHARLNSEYLFTYQIRVR